MFFFHIEADRKYQFPGKFGEKSKAFGFELGEKQRSKRGP